VNWLLHPLNTAADHLTWFGLYWVTWLLFFIVPELYWVFSNSVNTLSDQFWALEGLSFADPTNFAAWSPVHWTLAIIVWLLFLWLSLHLPFGWFR
jgi:hypothetical protein